MRGNPVMAFVWYFLEKNQGGNPLIDFAKFFREKAMGGHPPRAFAGYFLEKGKAETHSLILLSFNKKKLWVEIHP